MQEKLCDELYLPSLFWLHKKLTLANAFVCSVQIRGRDAVVDTSCLLLLPTTAVAPTFLLISSAAEKWENITVTQQYSICPPACLSVRLSAHPSKSEHASRVCDVCALLSNTLHKLKAAQSPSMVDAIYGVEAYRALDLSF